MEWLASQGALVWIPIGHSPDVDLMAEVDGRVLRIQVKTSTMRLTRPRGGERWAVSVATNGGNQSWRGTTKTFDPTRVDFLFVLVGDGRRWLIPAPAIESQRGMTLGGGKYSEFEIECGSAIEHLIYPDQPASLESLSQPGGAPESGEPGRPVKSVATLEWVRIPPPPLDSRSAGKTELPKSAEQDSAASAPLRFQRTQISSKHQVTIPSVPFRHAELQAGDRLHARADGPGRVVFERIDSSTGKRLTETRDRGLG
jgi:hypothetical protein